MILVFVRKNLLISHILFLEPKSGFKIAFNMFDTDGNQRVDKDEFLVVSKIYEYESMI